MGPGKHYREGVTVMEMSEMFGTEEKAVEWFEGLGRKPSSRRPSPTSGLLMGLPGAS